MNKYKFFVEELDEFIEKIHWGSQLNVDSQQKLYEYINGRASKELEKLVDSKTLANSCIFFTHPHLANYAISSNLLDKNVNNLKVFDPTCGAGDLLLKWCDFLPVNKDLATTVKEWGIRSI
ncbi:MAG: hypothetical protein PVH88_25660 [Ignavibacteria bacterium]|jgi:hypothetical protein